MAKIIVDYVVPDRVVRDDAGTRKLPMPPMGMPMPEKVATSIQACAAGLAVSCANDVEGMLKSSEQAAAVTMTDMLGDGFMVCPPYAPGMILPPQSPAEKSAPAARRDELPGDDDESRERTAPLEKPCAVEKGVFLGLTSWLRWRCAASSRSRRWNDGFGLRRHARPDSCRTL